MKDKVVTRSPGYARWGREKVEFINDFVIESYHEYRDVISSEEIQNNGQMSTNVQ